MKNICCGGALIIKRGSPLTSLEKFGCRGGEKANSLGEIGREDGTTFGYRSAGLVKLFAQPMEMVCLAADIVQPVVDFAIMQSEGKGWE